MNKRILFVAACFFFAITAPVFAQDAPLFTPTSGWLVGPASLIAAAEGDKSLPCLAANQYDNGYNVRLSGGDGRIFALVVDFRQNVFKAGATYDSALSVGDGYQEKVEGMAFNDATLIVNTQGAGDLYGALKKAQIMSLSLRGKQFDFALLGMDDALARMDACYRGDAPVTAQAGMKGPATMKKQEQAFKTITSPPVELPAAPPTETPVEKVEEPVREEPSAIATSLDAILKQAASRAQGIQTAKPASQEDVKADIAEKAQEPRKVIIEKDSGKPVAQSARAPTSVADAKESAVPRDIFVPNPRKRAGMTPGQSIDRSWKAPAGGSMREILGAWARTENAELIWSAPGDFPVGADIALNGTFEQAVQMTLDGYKGDGPRPTGRVYNDPGMLKKILLIQQDGK